MMSDPLTLPAFPGLLRRGSPVIVPKNDPTPEELVPCWRGVVTTEAQYPATETEPALYHVAPCDGDDGALQEWVGNCELDLSDPTGADHAVRWLAEQLELEIGTTAPRWTQDPSTSTPDAEWRLESAGTYRRFGSLYARGAVPYIIGIGAVTDPLIALRMACLAVAEQKGPKP